MPKHSRRLTETERDERRARDRERLRQATEALLTSEGWRQWVKTRATFHSYSLHNTLLLAHQCAARGITPTYVAGFGAWLRLNRCVRRGEAALWVIAPLPIKQQAKDGDEKRIFFRAVPVFELSQTEPLEGVEPVALEPPSAPIEGDSHAHLLEPLHELARDLGYTLDYAELDAGRRGLCDYANKRIVIESRQSPNAQVRVVIHELAHALGISTQRYGRERAEIIVETATFVVCSGLGLRTDNESVPYLAGWGENGALEALTEAARLIDHIAARIEQAVGLRDGNAGVSVERAPMTTSVA